MLLITDFERLSKWQQHLKKGSLVRITRRRDLFQGQGRQAVRYVHLGCFHPLNGAAQVTIVSAPANALVLPKVAIPAHDEGHQGMPAESRVRS
jgi:hypothetical protein